MNIPRTLWLHVGTHKTGTSSIQRALRMRKAELNARGMGIHPDKNAWAVANLFIRPELQTSPRISGKATEPTPAHCAEVLARLHKARGAHPDMIVSSEEFCLLRHPHEAEALRRSLGAMFSRVTPIVALRNETDWRASRRNQLVKRGYWEAQTKLPDAQSTDGAWYYDRAAISAFWARIGETVTLDYDAIIAAEGTILSAFARAIAQPGLFDGLDLWVNPRSEV